MVDKGTSKLKKIIIWILFLSIVLFFILYKSEAKIKYSDVKDYTSILQNISAMIFAIVGLWISSTYPTTKDAMISNDPKIKVAEFGDQTKRLESLIGVLITSALVMLSLLVFYAAKMIIPSFGFYQIYHVYFSYAGLSFLFGLGICQFIAVSYVILINVTFINELYRIIHNNDSENQF